MSDQVQKGKRVGARVYNKGYRRTRRKDKSQSKRDDMPNSVYKPRSPLREAQESRSYTSNHSSSTSFASLGETSQATSAEEPGESEVEFSQAIVPVNAAATLKVPTSPINTSRARKSNDTVPAKGLGGSNDTVPAIRLGGSQLDARPGRRQLKPLRPSGIKSSSLPIACM